MRHRYMFAGVIVVATTLSAFACSLDLDESLIEKRDGGTIIVGDVVVPEGGTVTESGVVENQTVTCTKNEECISANACLTGRCDLARRACAFEVCRPSTCNAGKCDEAARTCAAPAPYKREAASFQITAPFLCINCIVAAYPWVFAGTQGGVVAYNTSNPGNSAPPQVPVVGIGFVPNKMVRSGNRIWFAGQSVGPGTGPIRVPIAFIDVPSDPFTAQLKATTVLVEYKRTPEEPRVFARDNKSLLLVGPPPSFASIAIETTLAEPASVTPTPFAPPAETEAFGISGTRLVMMSTAAGTPSVNLVSNVGAGAVTVQRSIPLTDIGPTSPTRAYGWASGVDGTVFWAGAANSGGAPEPVLTRAVRGFFLTTDGTSSIPDAPKGTDIEVYAGMAGVGVLGGDADCVRFPALLDSNTAMVATTAKDDLTKVAVNFVRRDPLAVVADKRIVLSTPISAIIGSSASNGIGYFAANETNPSDAGPPAFGRIYAIDPACSP